MNHPKLPTKNLLRFPIDSDLERANNALTERRKIKHEGKFSEKRDLVASLDSEKFSGLLVRRRTLEQLVSADNNLLIGTLAVEVEWILLNIIRDSPAISGYVDLRERIDRSIRCGHNNKAQKLIDTIIEQYGWSFGILERWVLINFRLGNDSLVTIRLQQTLSSDLSALGKFAAAANSYRFNPIVPAEYYRRLSEANVNLIKSDEDTRSIARWLIGIASRQDFGDSGRVSRLLYTLGTFSVFDQYEMILSLSLKCGCLFSDSRVNQIFFSNLRKLSHLVNDPQLNWILGSKSNTTAFNDIFCAFPMRGQVDQELTEDGGDFIELLKSAFDADARGDLPFAALDDWLMRQPQGVFSVISTALVTAFEGKCNPTELYQTIIRFIPESKLNLHQVRKECRTGIQLLNQASESLLSGKLIVAYEQIVTWLQGAKKMTEVNLLAKEIVEFKRSIPSAFGIVASDLDIREFLSGYRMEGPEDIIVLLAFSYISESDMDISIRLEEYLEALGIQSPSELVHLLDEDLVGAFPLFIRDLCTLDQLEHLPLLGITEEDVIRERLSLLRQASELDEKAKALHQDEIASLVKLERICSMERIMEASRMLVDVSSIQRKVKLFYDKTEATNISLERAFQDLHQIVLGVFLLDEDHGLNAELSNRIRHGKLRERLLRPFVDNELIADNTDELAKSPLFNPTGTVTDFECEEVSRVLREFAIEVQRKVNYFGEERAQLRVIDLSWKGFPGLLTAKTAPDGLICVTRLKEESYTIFENCLGSRLEAEDVDLVIDASIEAIWAALEIQLSEARRIILSDLFDDLSQCLDSFEKGLSDIIGNSSHESIARCRSQLRSICEEVSGWFVRPTKVSMPSSRLDEIVELAKRAVETSGWGPFDISVATEIAGVLIESKLVSEVYDLLVLLLSNAGKHGNGKLPFQIGVDAFGDFSGLVVSNWGADSLDADVDEARRLLELAKRGANREALNREGKSGLAKVFRQLKRIERTDDLEVGVSGEDGMFRISLGCHSIFNHETL